MSCFCRLTHIYIHVYSYTGTAQQQGDIRLVNGSTFSGRLEIYSTREWVTICIDGFTMLSANTTCKQLGRAGAVSFGQAEILG